MMTGFRVNQINICDYILKGTYAMYVMGYLPIGAWRFPGQKTLRVPIQTFYFTQSFFIWDLPRFWSWGYPGVRGLSWRDHICVMYIPLRPYHTPNFWKCRVVWCKTIWELGSVWLCQKKHVGVWLDELEKGHSFLLEMGPDPSILLTCSK